MVRGCGRRREVVGEPDTSQRPRGLVRVAPWLGMWAIFRRFWPETRAFRGRLLLNLALVAAGPLLGAVGIWLFKILVDEVLTGRRFGLFPALAAAYIGITVGEGMVSFADDYLTAWLGENLVLRLRTRLFDHLQRLSLGFFDRHELGDILSRLTGDIGAIEDVVLSSVAQTLSYVVQVVAFAGALFYLNWRLALIALLVAPVFLLLARWFSRRIRDASREKRRRAGSITAAAEESLSNLALVQAYDRQAAQSARFRRENLASVAAQLAATRLQALFTPMVDLFEVLGVLLVVRRGHLGAGPQPDHPRRAAGLPRLPQPALRAHTRLRSAVQLRVRRQRRRRTGHRPARPAAGGDRSPTATPALHVRPARSPCTGSGSPIPTPPGPPWSS